MFLRFFGCFHLCVFIIFIDFNQSQKSLFSLTSKSIRTVFKPEVPTSKDPPFPYCRSNPQSPLICGENCLTVIQESDTIVFFESINFPLFMGYGADCNLNFILNFTESGGVSY